MPEMTNHPPGTFCWVDLATTDTDAAKAFYTELFGWEAVDTPTDVGVPYSMLLKAGKPVCALYPMGPDQSGVAHWQSYVTVDDVDVAAAAVETHGGNLLMPPMDVMQAGRMAIVQDTTGAVLGLWQPRDHAGAELWNVPGAACWNELQTNDVAQAGRFYGDLFGWTTKVSQDVMEGRYSIFVSGGQQIGGMMQIEPDWGPMPPNWSVYFGVEDCDAAIAEAERLGGKLLVPAMEVENVGRFAFLQDPQGAVFAVIQSAHSTVA